MMIMVIILEIILQQNSYCTNNGQHISIDNVKLNNITATFIMIISNIIALIRWNML